MGKIKLQDLKDFCTAALVKEGMQKEYAAITAQVLSETDAYGTYSHGTKNLHSYIKKARMGGINIKAVPEIERQGPAFAVYNAQRSMGMVAGVLAMQLACEKAQTTGIALVSVKNSCHFGAAGYYANMAAAQGMLGIAFSNVDPNMNIPGARGKAIGNNPLAYASPAQSSPSVFLDIALSNVASLKVFQARANGESIPASWIVDKDGLPTQDPSHYPEEGAMQPMAAHKGYGLALMVELLTGILNGGETSMGGNIESWLTQMEKPNNVSHSFIAVAPALFLGGQGSMAQRTETAAQTLRALPKAKGQQHIYTPGQLEWQNHQNARDNGINLPAELEKTLKELAAESGILLKLF